MHRVYTHVVKVHTSVCQKSFILSARPTCFFKAEYVDMKIPLYVVVKGVVVVGSNPAQSMNFFFFSRSQKVSKFFGGLVTGTS